MLNSTPTTQEQAAYLFIRNLGLAFLQWRKVGGEFHLPDFDQNMAEGISHLLFSEDEAALIERLAQNAKRLITATSSALDDDCVDEAIVHELIEARLIQVDYQILMWVLCSARFHDDELRCETKFLAKLKSRLRLYNTYVASIPCPSPVAFELQRFSQMHYIQGSPLFSCWDDRPDIQKVQEKLLLLYAGEDTKALEEMGPSDFPDTDWIKAPVAVKNWDMSVWKDFPR